jgi:phosphatidylglycerophosphatase A
MKNKFFITQLPPDMPISNANVLIATWGGVGLLRPAPGTLGTLAAFPFGYTIMSMTGPIGLGVAALALTVLGAMAANRFSAKTGTVDDQSIVVDEVVGFWIAALPAGLNPMGWLIAFVLFRFFDIVKPWPASFFDNRSKNGWDVMLDDVVAGIYALMGVAMYALLVLATQST